MATREIDRLPKLRVPIGCVVCSLALLLTAAVAVGEEPQAMAPQEVIRLFNGRDLAGLYTWVSDTKYEDPRHIFTVADGMLRVSGDGIGYICTRERYRDYHLVLEYRWGEKTWGNRVNAARDSGLIVHAADPDGSFGGSFMAGIEAQIIEGGTGDLLVLPGKREDGSLIPASATANVVEDRDGEAVWSEQGQERVMARGRINWCGRDVDWKDVKGFRGPADLEHPSPDWNRYEVVCSGDRIECWLNGVKVNEARQLVPNAGKILLQTELAELFVRRLELWPLGKAPPTRPGWKDGQD